MKFRKRPKKYEAMQFTGSNAKDLLLFKHEALESRIIESAGDTPYVELVKGIFWEKENIELNMQQGDWLLVKEGKHCSYTKKELFEQTYEEIKE